MFAFLDPLRDLTIFAVLFRFIYAVICGTALGFERSYKNKPAGFRTHILVCTAACTATLTGLYMYLDMGMPADISRIGGQVITGMSFLGAGTIFVTNKNTVKGLTTAAGLWTAAIAGVAIGSGFYEGALVTVILVLIAQTYFSEVRNKITYHPEFRIAVSYYTRKNLDAIIRSLKDRNLSITNLQITSNSESAPPVYSALISIRQRGTLDRKKLIEEINRSEGIISAEEF